MIALHTVSPQHLKSLRGVIVDVHAIPMCRFLPVRIEKLAPSIVKEKFLRICVTKIAVNLISLMIEEGSSTLVNISVTFVSNKRAVTFSNSGISSSISFQMLILTKDILNGTLIVHLMD